MQDLDLVSLLRPPSNLPRPDDQLGIRPRIKSTDDAELALRELSWCAAVQAAVTEQAQQLIGAIQDAAKHAAVFQSGEESVPIADRRAALEAELLRWADANRITLCPGKKKSVALTHGTIKWRDGKDSVEYAEGWTQKAAIKVVGNESGLLAKIEALVDKLDWFGVFEAKLSVNRTNACKARNKQQLSDERLSEVGLEFREGEEYITVEPAEFVRSGSI